jgi:hypothetical protein
MELDMLAKTLPIEGQIKRQNKHDHKGGEAIQELAVAECGEASAACCHLVLEMIIEKREEEAGK